MSETKYYWEFQLIEETRVDGLFFLNKVTKKVYEGLLTDAIKSLYLLLMDELREKYPEAWIYEETYLNGVSMRDQKSNTIIAYNIRGVHDGLEECDEAG